MPHKQDTKQTNQSHSLVCAAFSHHFFDSWRKTMFYDKKKSIAMSTEWQISQAIIKQMMLECLYRIKARKVLGQRKWTAQKWDLQTIIYLGSIRVTWNKKNIIVDALDYTHTYTHTYHQRKWWKFSKESEIKDHIPNWSFHLHIQKCSALWTNMENGIK